MQTTAPNVPVVQLPTPVPQPDTTVQRPPLPDYTDQRSQIQQKIPQSTPTPDMDKTAQATPCMDYPALPPNINQLVPSKHVNTAIK